MYGFRLKGKEYINNRLEFEGEYLFNNKFNGKGFDENKNVIYELKNGTGKIKKYGDNGDIIYEEEYVNGKRITNGKNNYFKCILKSKLNEYYEPKGK